MKRRILALLLLLSLTFTSLPVRAEEDVAPAATVLPVEAEILAEPEAEDAVQPSEEEILPEETAALAQTVLPDEGEVAPAPEAEVTAAPTETATAQPAESTSLPEPEATVVPTEAPQAPFRTAAWMKTS